MRFCKSFQHENVFGRYLTEVNREKWNFYLNLTFEASISTLNSIFNLNKMYENNLQEVVIFITVSPA
jgi:hypothetical protein